MFSMENASAVLEQAVSPPSQLDKFNFIIVLVSIILSLGLSKLIAGIGYIVEHRKKVSVYPLHLMAITLVFLLQMQFWWALFDERQIESWNFFMFLFFSLAPLLYYLISELLVPHKDNADEMNFAEYYWRRNQIVYFLGIAVEINKSISDLLLFQDAVHWEQHLIRGVAVGLLLVMIVVQKQRIHYLIYSILGLLFVYFVLEYSFNLIEMPVFSRQ